MEGEGDGRRSHWQGQIRYLLVRPLYARGTPGYDRRSGTCQICDFQSYAPDEAKKTQTEVVDQKRRTRFDHRVGDRDRELSSSEGTADVIPPAPARQLLLVSLLCLEFRLSVLRTHATVKSLRYRGTNLGHRHPSSTKSTLGGWWVRGTRLPSFWPWPGHGGSPVPPYCVSRRFLNGTRQI